MSKVKFFVESIPLVEDRPSGVGHTVLNLVGALAANSEFTKSYEIVLVAPKRALHKLDRWPELAECKRLGLPLRMRIINGLMRLRVMPPMDMLLGRGIYLFGNFKNWPVSNRSVSFTYIHDIAFALFPEFVSPKNQRMLEKNVPRYIRQTDYIVAVSECSKTEIVDYFKVEADKVVVVYNGVEQELFHPYSEAKINKVKDKYGIKGRYFVYVGNIEPRKNLQILVEAFHDLPKDVSLVLVGGSGWLNEPIVAAIERARKSGASIIKPKNYVSDEEVAILMSGSVALAHPALHEGFGITPVEGLAAGTLVAAADIPPIREAVGDNAVYFNPLSESEVNSALLKCLAITKDKREKIAKKGIERSKIFSWDSAAEKLYNFLQEIRAR